MISTDQILFEDNHLIIINKRSGQIVQGDKTGDISMADEIKEFLKIRDHKSGNVFCGVIHRLDRPVSGAVMFAKTSKALSRMNEAVKNHELKKTYWAITKELPPMSEGHLEEWMFRKEALNKSFIVDSSHPNAQLAILDYKMISISRGGYHLIEVNLHTGRHHQIRCQLAHLGCPIKGDLKYGAPRSNADGSISLHARELEFLHPVKKEWCKVLAPAPKDFDIFKDTYNNIPDIGTNNIDL